ncbi:YqcC family protein [Orbus sturtevantii]|uniref:YqcC family protein n=1 Tax=Orbus sturtevantii TaxID=3074109 RepID=UPI00370D2C76
MHLTLLWQSLPPKAEAFLSEQPFALDMMTSHEWLQWIFIPRIRALIDAKAPLPRNFILYPYFEETLKEREDTAKLLSLIEELDKLVKV